MAVVITKSGSITNRDATPKVLTNSSLNKASMLKAAGTIETTGSDSTGSTYLFCSLPSNARVSDVLFSVDGNNTAGTLDIGIYQTTANGSAVVDADFFASAQALSSALARTSVVHESAVYGIEDIEKPLWEALGLTEDSNIDYDVVGTIVTADDAADTVSLEIQYGI